MARQKVRNPISSETSFFHSERERACILLSEWLTLAFVCVVLSEREGLASFPESLDMKAERADALTCSGGGVQWISPSAAPYYFWSNGSKQQHSLLPLPKTDNSGSKVHSFYILFT